MTDAREALADLAHQRWSLWMRHLFSCCRFERMGAIIPPAMVRRWNRQLKTPYADLSEEEKESDRKEADLVLALLASTVESDAERAALGEEKKGTDLPFELIRKATEAGWEAARQRSGARHQDGQGGHHEVVGVQADDGGRLIRRKQHELDG